MTTETKRRDCSGLVALDEVAEVTDEQVDMLRRRAQARQQGPRGTCVGYAEGRRDGTSRCSTCRTVHAHPGGLACASVTFALTTAERHTPDVACDWCGGAHGTRMCPNARPST